MSHRSIRTLLLATCLSLLPAVARAQTTEPAMPGKVQTSPIPDEYTDPETHLRVVHLSRVPNDYSGVVYFTYNNYTPDSRFALIDTQFKDKWRYLYSFDLSAMTCKPLVTDRLTQNQVVAPKSGNVYYQADHGVWVIPLAGGTPRKLCDMPKYWDPGTGFTINADETLLLGGSTDVDESTGAKLGKAGTNPEVLFTVNLKTGELKVIHRDVRWLGHVQFSPTDPDLCMFCNEGNWESVDRIWFIHPSKSSIDANGKVTSDGHVAYHRKEPREIVGHEFWQPDGKQIWFQQGYRAGNTNRGGLTAMDIATGKVTQYHVPRGFGGIHETFSPDGTFLIGDGSGPKGNTKPGIEKYINKLTLPTDGSDMLKGEHLVNMAANDYAVEPNPHVSPDNRWVTFTATLHGTAQAYAVELPRK